MFLNANNSQQSCVTKNFSELAGTSIPDIVTAIALNPLSKLLGRQQERAIFLDIFHSERIEPVADKMDDISLRSTA